MRRTGCLPRLLAGFGLVLLLLIVGFAWMLAIIPTWGTTKEEIQQALPGDERVSAPLIVWNHAVTIAATPEEIWPWIIQMGDTRGGYYSFSFIEQAISGPGFYVNADRVHPEWQNPPKGQGMIGNFLVIADYQPNQWLLTETTDELPGFKWTWLWALQPVDATHTRLLVRHHILPPADMANPMVGGLVNASGYVMERKMMDGIRVRAEGASEPAFAQPLGIVLWLATFGTGVAAAFLYLTRPDWPLPLCAGMDALVLLFVLTYLQPPQWIGWLLLLALVALLTWVWRHPLALQLQAVLKESSIGPSEKIDL